MTHDRTPQSVTENVSPASPSTGRMTAQSYVGKARSVRERVRSRTVSNLIYRVIVGLIGLVVVAGGLVMVPFPGPGWLVVVLGLAILASEFEPARRLLDFVRDKLVAWTHWLGRQGWPVRLLVAGGTALCVAAALYGIAVVLGVPSWIPDWLVPPLPGLH